MANYGQGFLGSLQGASAGAGLGSLLGPIGTGVGAGVGALGGGLAGLFGGNNPSQPPSAQNQNPAMSGLSNLPGQFAQLQKFTPEQLNAIKQLLSGGLSQLQNPQQGFQPIEQLARNQFHQQTIPGLAERFTSLGSGAQRSSAFQGALGSAATGLESNLAALRSQYGMQNQKQGLQQLGLGLTPQFENLYFPEKPGFFSQLAPGVGQGLGSLLSVLALLGGQKYFGGTGKA